jgi:hypothetical protein
MSETQWVLLALLGVGVYWYVTRRTVLGSTLPTSGPIAAIVAALKAQGWRVEQNGDAFNPKTGESYNIYGNPVTAS